MLDRPSPARQGLAACLAVAAALLGLAGGVAAYVDDRIVDRAAFADSALDALDREPVRRAVSEELGAQLTRSFPAALVPRRQVQRAADAIVDTPAFRRAFRRSAAGVNRMLFSRGADDAALRLDSLQAALADVDPRLARVLPGDLSARLLTLRADRLGVDTRRIGDAVGSLKVVLPALALVLLIGALAVGPDRRRVVRTGAATTAVGAGALLLTLPFARSLTVDQVEAGRGVDLETARAAIGEVWDVYAGDLRGYALIALVGGVAVTAVTLLPLGRRRRAAV